MQSNRDLVKQVIAYPKDDLESSWECTYLDFHQELLKKKVQKITELFNNES